MASDQGFDNMDEQKQKDAASKGGQNQGQENNPANFANDTTNAREAGEQSGDDLNDY